MTKKAVKRARILIEEIPPMRGRLVVYRALASKFTFYFQPREKQEIYGKRFIPCRLAPGVSEEKCLELMKSYYGNIVIRGRGIKSKRGFYREIEISSLEKEEQLRLFSSL